MGKKKQDDPYNTGYDNKDPYGTKPKKRKGVTGSVQINPGVPIERQRIRAQAQAVNEASGRGRDSRLGPNPQVRNGIQRDANAMNARNTTIDASIPQERVMVRPPEPRFGDEQPYKELGGAVAPPIPRAEMNQAVMKRRVAEISQMSPEQAQTELDRGKDPRTFAGSDREMNPYQQGVMDKLGGYFDAAKEFGGDMVRQVPGMSGFGLPERTLANAPGADPYNTGYDNKDTYGTKPAAEQSALDPGHPDFVGPPDPGKQGVQQADDPYNTGYDNKDPYGNGKDYLAEGETANTREESMEILRKNGLRKLGPRDTSLGRQVTGMADSRGGAFSNRRALSHIDRNFDKLNEGIAARSSSNSAAAARIMSDNEDNRFDQKTRVNNTGAFRERTASSERINMADIESREFQTALSAEAAGRELSSKQRGKALDELYTSYDDDGNKIVDYKGKQRLNALFPGLSLNEQYAAQPVADFMGKLEEKLGRRINDISEVMGGRTETITRPDGSKEVVLREGAKRRENVSTAELWRNRHHVSAGSYAGEVVDFLPFYEKDWLTLPSGESIDISDLGNDLTSAQQAWMLGKKDDPRRVTTREFNDRNR
jgi:hypothetical protein